MAFMPRTMPSVGCMRDGADAAFADVLRGLADDVDGRRDVEAFAGDADGGEDLGNLTFGELAIDGGSGDLNYFAYDVGGCCCRCHNNVSLSLRPNLIPRCGSAADDFDNFFGDAA